MPTPQPLAPPDIPRTRPEDLTPEERRRAIAEILARGVRRYLEGLPLPVDPPRPKKQPRPRPTSDAPLSPPGER